MSINIIIGTEFAVTVKGEVSVNVRQAPLLPIHGENKSDDSSEQSSLRDILHHFFRLHSEVSPRKIELRRQFEVCYICEDQEC